MVVGSTHKLGNKLDLILCNSPEIIANVTTSDPGLYNFPTDHLFIDFQIIIKFSRTTILRRKTFDFKKADFDGLRNFLPCVPFDIPLSEENIDLVCKNWKDLFLATVDKFVPTKVIKDCNSPPWIDGEVRHMIRKKYDALRRYRHKKSVDRKRKLRLISQKIKYMYSSQTETTSDQS